LYKRVRSLIRDNTSQKKIGTLNMRPPVSEKGQEETNKEEEPAMFKKTLRVLLGGNEEGGTALKSRVTQKNSGHGHEKGGYRVTPLVGSKREGWFGGCEILTLHSQKEVDVSGVGSQRPSAIRSVYYPRGKLGRGTETGKEGCRRLSGGVYEVRQRLAGGEKDEKRGDAMVEGDANQKSPNSSSSDSGFSDSMELVGGRRGGGRKSDSTTTRRVNIETKRRYGRERTGLDWLKNHERCIAMVRNNVDVIEECRAPTRDSTRDKKESTRHPRGIRAKKRKGRKVGR